MNYKGWDVSIVVGIRERQELDERGNVIGYRDSWQDGVEYWEADNDYNQYFYSEESFDDLIAQIDAFIKESSE